MKSRPVVVLHYEIYHTSFKIDFEFDNNITILMGESGTGKTTSYSFIADEMALDDRIVCFNYRDNQKNIKEELLKLNGKFVVIDNIDIILDEEARKYISTDLNNQYLLIGRDPRNLFATSDNYYELISEKEGELTVFRIKKYIV